MDNYNDYNDIIKDETVFEGVIFNVRQLEILTSSGIIKRDIVTKNPVAICLVWHRTKEKYILTKEYRAGRNEIGYGLVGGIVDNDEVPMQAAVREVIEETGYTPVSIEYLGEASTSAGFTNEIAHHFYVEVDGDQGDQNLDSDESIEIGYAADIIEVLYGGEMKGSHAHANILKCIMKGWIVIENS